MVLAPRAFALLSLAFTACAAPPPAMTPTQLCEKQAPLAEAWRVADGQDAMGPEQAATALKGCIKHWTEQQKQDAARFAKIAACAQPATTYDAIEKCMIDNLPQ